MAKYLGKINLDYFALKIKLKHWLLMFYKILNTQDLIPKSTYEAIIFIFRYLRLNNRTERQILVFLQ